MPPSSSPQAVRSQSPSFLSSTPPPVLRFLTAYGGIIDTLRWAIDVWNWEEGRRVDAVLVLASWWGICVAFGPFFRYGLPLLLFFYLHPIDLASASIPYFQLPKFTNPSLLSLSKSKRTASSPDSLSRTLSTLALLPPPNFSLPHQTIIPLIPALRITAACYVAYVIFSFFIPLPVLLGILGTIVLTYSSPYAVAIRMLIVSSGFHRWVFSITYTRVAGEEVPSSLHLDAVGELKAGEKGKTKRRSSTIKSLSTSTSASFAEGTQDKVPMRFRFDIYENQRWWMGLDWTSALLPSDPPTYTAAPSSNPTLPNQPPTPPTPAPSPASLTLPAPSTTTLPHPTGSSLRVRRTAVWSWEDPEWRVVVHREKGGEIERIAVPLPEAHGTEKPDSKGDSTLMGKVEEAMRKAKGKTGSIEPGTEKDVGAVEEETDQLAGEDGESGMEDDLEESEELTDQDGWTYFDNKWQGGGAKGGMGKYTRHRRWTRIAVCTETITIVPTTPSSAPATSSTFPTSSSINPITPSASASYPTTSPYQFSPSSAPSTAETDVSVQGQLQEPMSPTKAQAVPGRRSGELNRRPSWESATGSEERPGLRARLRNVVAKGS